MLKKLLLIDDDPDECHIISEILTQIDSTIACYYAFSGPNALDQMNNGDIMLPDLLIIDINMPGMDGWEFLAIIRNLQRYKDIPAIIYSTSSRSEEIDRARRLGVSYFIKQTDVNELKEMLLLLVNESFQKMQ